MKNPVFVWLWTLAAATKHHTKPHFSTFIMWISTTSFSKLLKKNYLASSIALETLTSVSNSRLLRSLPSPNLSIKMLYPPTCGLYKNKPTPHILTSVYTRCVLSSCFVLILYLNTVLCYDIGKLANTERTSKEPFQIGSVFRKQQSLHRTNIKNVS